LHHLRQKEGGLEDSHVGAAPPTGRKTNLRMSVMPGKKCKDHKGDMPKPIGGGSPRGSVNLLGGAALNSRAA